MTSEIEIEVNSLLNTKKSTTKKLNITHFIMEGKVSLAENVTMT